MNGDEKRPPTDEWHEVQERRYDKGFYPGSGKINPFFRKLGAPDARFGIQLLIAGALIIVLPRLFGLTDRAVQILLLVIAAVLLIGGVAHIRSAGRGSKDGAGPGASR